VSGSGISCQQPTAQFFTGRMPFLPPNQQCQSTRLITQTKNDSILVKLQNVLFTRVVISEEIHRVKLLFYIFLFNQHMLHSTPGQAGYPQTDVLLIIKNSCNQHSVNKSLVRNSKQWHQYEIRNIIQWTLSLPSGFTKLLLTKTWSYALIISVSLLWRDYIFLVNMPTIISQKKNSERCR